MNASLSVWRRHLLIVDTFAVIIAGLALLIWAYVFDGSTVIEATLENNRTPIYRTTASIAASLLGFSLTVISIVVGFSSYERLANIRKNEHYSTLWEIFFSTVTALAILLFVSFICLIFDRDKAPILWLEIIFFEVDPIGWTGSGHN